MKTAKTEVAANSDVTSGPKYCEGDHTTADPSGETDSMRVMSYNLYGWNALVQVNSTLVQCGPLSLVEECRGSALIGS